MLTQWYTVSSQNQKYVGDAVARRDAFEKPFEPGQIESDLRNYWESHKFFRAKREAGKTPYTIVMPPPNVTGDLTIGHVLNNTLQDILIRWNRANGKAACWIPGTDHASIATEAKVTKMLAEQGINKRDIGREEFLKHAWVWKDKYGGRIVSLLKTLGVSCDWDREVFTMAPEYSRAVIKAIVKLYKDGLIYRGYRLVNWCPVSQSVISDEEVNPEERNGHLWHIRYPIEGAEGQYLIVATTRPETLFGDLAVAVHPTDERYASLIGKKVIVPVCNRAIPVIADTYVEKEFGTGVVKITPAHDMNDFAVGERHKLGLLNVMNPDATLNEKVPAAYQGLDRFIARKKLVAELEATGLLEKTAPHKMVVGISERGGVPIEYYLSEQWYIKMDKLAEIALGATRTSQLKLHPPHMEKIWEYWLTNIKDWCISRQLWWGHQMPMYTCQACGHVSCEEEKPSACEKCGHTHLAQDSDCLDTWASSWLWPFGVHNWANPTEEQKQDLAYFYPTDIIVTGPDIIFFWIARMIMAGGYFTDKTAFKDVYFTPIIRDSKGRKMSKSLGNSPDVNQLIAKYGTDALRFSVINQVVLGQDIFWADEACDLGRTFANKIWNATRFLLMNAEKYELDSAAINFDQLVSKPSDTLLGWMTSEFFAVAQKAHDSIEKLEFAGYTSSLYEFVWMVYCDWFVELCKPRLMDPAAATSEQKELARQTLRTAFQLLDGVLRLLHPVMPFVTEQIWQNLGDRKGTTIGHAALPRPRADMIDAHAISAMREVQSVVSAIRAVRGQFAIHPGADLKVTVNASRERFGLMVPQMEFLARAVFSFSSERPALCGTALAGGMEVFVDVAGFVDPAAERDRLLKKIQKVEQTLEGIRKRLANEEFMKSAPEKIVLGAREQFANNEKELSVLQASLQSLN
jgi:valyl-tRNA synthetase